MVSSDVLPVMCFSAKRKVRSAGGAGEHRECPDRESGREFDASLENSGLGSPEYGVLGNLSRNRPKDRIAWMANHFLGRRRSRPVGGVAAGAGRGWGSESEGPPKRDAVL